MALSNLFVPIVFLCVAGVSVAQPPTPPKPAPAKPAAAKPRVTAPAREEATPQRRQPANAAAIARGQQRVWASTAPSVMAPMRAAARRAGPTCCSRRSCSRTKAAQGSAGFSRSGVPRRTCRSSTCPGSGSRTSPRSCTRASPTPPQAVARRSSILVGDPKAGAAYFNGPGGCTTCHSVTGDLDAHRREVRPGHAAGPDGRAARTRWLPGAGGASERQAAARHGDACLGRAGVRRRASISPIST